MENKSTTFLNTKRITICALLVALGVVFGRLLSYDITITGIKAMNIGLGTMPIILICVLYGPLYGAIGALSWDLIGALVFPSGSFNPAFSLSAALFGCVIGLFFAKNQNVTFKRVLLSCFCGQFFYSVILNTALLFVFYLDIHTIPVYPILIARSLENLFMVLINTVLVMTIVTFIKRYSLMPERFSAGIVYKNKLKNEIKQQKLRSKSEE